MKYINRNAWFIIDFKDASEYLTTGIRHLDNSNYSLKIFNNFHDTSVDMWLIGYLIIMAHVELSINNTLKKYAIELMKDDTPISAEMVLEFL